MKKQNIVVGVAPTKHMHNICGWVLFMADN